MVNNLWHGYMAAGYGWSDKPDPWSAGAPNVLYNFENWAEQLADFVTEVRRRWRVVGS